MIRLILLVLILLSALSTAFSSSLTTAISKGETEKALKILQRDPASANIADEYGNYPLHLAVYNENEELLEAIINAGAQLELHDFDEATPLLSALEIGNAAIVKILLNSGADATIRGSTGQGALAYDLDTETQKLLIEKGASVNIADDAGITPLMRTMQNNNVDKVKLLVEHGADFSARDHENLTVLHYAASSGNLYLVMMAIAMKGGTPLDIDDSGVSPLTALFHHATPEEEGDTDTEANLKSINESLKLFNERQLAELHKELGEQITDNYIAISNIFLNRGADLNRQDETGNTPFMKSAESGRLELVKFLVTRGAKLSIRNDIGETALFFATRSGNLEVVRLLVSKGADINQKDKNGDSLFDLALMNDYLPIIEYLLSEGYKVNTLDRKGQTPLMKTISFPGNIDTINLLLENDADIALEDNNGNTALHYAAINNNSEAVTLLLAKGAKWDLRNKRGQTAIDVALDNFATDALKTICKFADIPVPKRKK